MSEHRQIKIQYFDGCPNWRVAAADVVEALERLGLEIELVHERIESVDEAERVGFRGSPTVLIDGRDPFADPDAPEGMSCRVYRTASGTSGSPGVDALEAVLRERPS